ncbi:YfhO family protein, partial [Candidatus Latescibacterota bacterium]
GFIIDVTCGQQGLVVLSENYVPYWSAEVDDKAEKVYRAYGTFMAVGCPEGNHRVKFTFRSGPYETGKKMTLIGFWYVIAVVFTTAGMQWVEKKKLRR